MPERRKNNPPERDTRPLWQSADGTFVRLKDLYAVFERRNDRPDIQFHLAVKCISDRKISPDIVLGCINDATVRDYVISHCVSQNIKVGRFDAGDQDERNARANRIVANDADLIRLLGPHVSQRTLAHIINLQKFREADEETRNILLGVSYRTLSSVLGPRRHVKNTPPDNRSLPLPELPIEIFLDDLVFKTLLEDEREHLLPIFNVNPSAGFEHLEARKGLVGEELKKQFVDEQISYFQKAMDFNVPGFKKLIPGSYKDLPEGVRPEPFVFPSFPQREYAYRFVNKEIGPFDLLVAGTRTRKTKTSIYAMKAAGAKSTIVVCPPGLNRDNWEKEINEVVEGDVDVAKITSASEFFELIDDKSDRKPNYTIIGYSLLSGLDVRAPELLGRLIKKVGADSLIMDEVHLANNPDAACSKNLFILSRSLDETSPRIAMTATGIINTIEDLDGPVRYLKPYRYSDPGSFTTAARNRPDLVSTLLHGQQLLTRWTVESIFGDSLPKVDSIEVPVPLSLFHKALYDFVYLDDTIEDRAKRGMLRQVALNPELIKRHYHSDGIQALILKLQVRKAQEPDEKKIEQIDARIRMLEERREKTLGLCDEQSARDQLEEAYHRFVDWRDKHNPNAKFDEDFLVLFGFDKVAIWSFLQNKEGVSGIIQKIPDLSLQNDWQPKETASSKYDSLFNTLDSLDPKKTKVIVYSGFYQSDVTSIDDEEIEGDSELAFDSLYQKAVRRYGSGVLRIDGTVSTEPKKNEMAERERARLQFRLNPERWLMFATIRSSRLGIDLSIPDIAENSNIEKVVLIYLDPPDTHADMDQTLGRVRNPDQKIPIEQVFMMTTDPQLPETTRYGFIDQSIREGVEFKRLLSQTVLDGIPLSKEEEDFLNRHLRNIHVDDLHSTPIRYLRDVLFRQVRGMGAEINRNLMLQESKFDGLTLKELFAAYYTLQDFSSVPGYAAKATTEVIRKYDQDNLKDFRIASIGSGASILQWTLGVPVVNLDLFSEFLIAGRDRNNGRGTFIAGDAAKLPFKDAAFNITEAGFMLHWSSNRIVNGSTERGNILKEFNRITKEDGLVTFTLPSTHLNERRFQKWLGVLEESFGFKQSSELPSGLLLATDFRTEPVGWIFNLIKSSNPSPFFEPSNLSLDFEPADDIINPGNRDSTVRDIRLDTGVSLPHVEFLIKKPGTNEEKALIYDLPLTLPGEIEENILGGEFKNRTALEILESDLGREPGFAYRLRRYIKSRWIVNTDQADEAIFRVIDIWRNGRSYDRHNVPTIWHDMRQIAEKLMIGRRLKW